MSRWFQSDNHQMRQAFLWINIDNNTVRGDESSPVSERYTRMEKGIVALVLSLQCQMPT
jgi:hypothetical protein